MSCGEASKPKERALSVAHADLANRFGQAVLAKDYTAAYALTSESFKKDIPFDEFKESISRYREGVEGKLTFTAQATEEDPKQIQEDSLVQMFVSDPKLRESIQEEVVLHFEVAEGEGWALVFWIVSEGGLPRILNYYQDD